MTARPPLGQQPEPPQDPDGLGGVLSALYERLSDQIAGGKRTASPMLALDDPDAEGFLPDEYRQQVPAMDWFDPAMFAQMDPANPTTWDFSSLPSAGGPGQAGKGMDWFRSGEAPNNFQNRSNPLYQSRRDFAVGIAGELRQMFDVTDQGSAGYMRDPHPSHAAPGGPSGNSDHYSGGAIDFFGSKSELTRLRNWLVEQPFVSFVRWQTESHFDHVHVSFDLNWVAQNFYGGQGDLAALMSGVNTAATTDDPATEAPELPDSPAGVRAE